MKKAGANAGFNVTATIEDGEDDDDDDSDEDYDGCEETSLEVSQFKITTHLDKLLMLGTNDMGLLLLVAMRPVLHVVGSRSRPDIIVVRHCCSCCPFFISLWLSTYC